MPEGRGFRCRNSLVKPKRLKVPEKAPMVTVTMCMPTEMVAALKKTAAKKQMPYQVMIKKWLQEKLRVEG